MANGIVGNDCTLTMGTGTSGGGPGHTVLIKSLTWTGATVADVDVTNLTSVGTSGGSAKELSHDFSNSVVRAFRPGSIDFGSINVTGSFLPTDEIPIDGAYFASFVLTFPKGADTTAATMTFGGYTNNMSVNGMGTDEELAVDFTVKISGTPAFTDATS